jgi:hypothetical protein
MYMYIYTGEIIVILRCAAELKVSIKEESKGDVVNTLDTPVPDPVAAGVSVPEVYT